MNYPQFISAMETRVKQCVNEDVTVYQHTSIKNNGKERKGLTVVETGINISPTIYLEEYYEQFLMGKSLEQIVKKVMELYKEVKFEHSWKENTIKIFNHIKHMIVYKVINYEKNEKMLENTPHTRYLDLAVVFYVLLEINKNGTATLLIKEEHLELWGVTKEDVEKEAKNNSHKLLPAEFKTMISVITELLSNEEISRDTLLQDTSLEEDTMYVLSNNQRNYGAVSILYDGLLKDIGEHLQENFYVLPSSVHEVIIVPESNSPGREELEHMIVEINETQVEPEEVLSDRAYYYSRKEERLLY